MLFVYRCLMYIAYVIHLNLKFKLQLHWHFQLEGLSITSIRTESSAGAETGDARLWLKWITSRRHIHVNHEYRL